MHQHRERCAAVVWSILLVFFSLLPWQTLAAADAPCASASRNGAPSVRFTHISVDQGLSQSTVNAVLQDHVGFMWFGTEEGLNRYDGYSFVVYRHNSSDVKSLPDDVVTAMLEDHRQQVWVGTQHGLSLFDRASETFTRIPSISNKVNTIVEGRDGTLWVGTEGQGLFERKPGSDEFIGHKHSPNDATSLASDGILALLMDREDQLWIGTNDGGVDLVLAGDKRFLHHRHDDGNPHSLSNDDVSALAEDSAGGIWIATAGGGLNVLDAKAGFFKVYRHDAKDPHSLASDRLLSLFTDRSGTLWVGSDGAGLQQYDAASGKFYTFAHDPLDANSASQNVIRTIYQDVQGQLWVGTYMGGVNLAKSAHSAFCYFTHNATDPTTLGNAGVVSFLEDKDGRLWVGTEGGWLHRFDPQTGLFTRYLFPSSIPGGSAILSLHQDRQGRIWVGSYEGGLGLFDPAKGTFKVYKHTQGDPRSLSNDEIWAMTESTGSTSGIWLGTNGGLDLFDPESGWVMAHYETPNPGGPSNPGVRSLLWDKQGNLWVGTFGGLNVLRRGNFVNSDSFVHFRHNDQDPYSLSDDAVISLHEDRHGQVWVGTLGGLNRIDDIDAGTFTSFKDFPSNTIYGIQEEPSGRLWLSTNHGLVRFDPASNPVGKFEVFDLGNGLQTLQFHSYASLKTQSGRLLFGSIDGFYYFDPEAIKPDTFAPPVVLTSLHVFNDSRMLSPELTISPSDKIFSLEFAALDYTVPRRNRYAYTLEGLTDKRIDLGSKHEVTFTNLDPGSYTLKIMASNSDGVWNDASTVSLKVFVQAPFWKTWWFRLLCILVLAIIAYALYSSHMNQCNAQIAAAKADQEKLLQELEASKRQRKDLEDLVGPGKHIEK